MKVQQSLDKIWQWLNGDRRLLDILIALLVIQALILFIPQVPFPRSDDPNYSRWIAELNPVLGEWTVPLSTIGLLTLRTSIWIRGLFAILVLVVVVRSASRSETWGELTVVRKWLHIALCLGSLLIISGWGMHVLGGWKQPDVIAWPGTEISIPERSIVLPPQKQRRQLWSGQYGLYLVPKGSSVGLEVQAFDEDGNVLPLLSSARGDPQPKLRLTLMRQVPEAYFALPDKELVFRVSRTQDDETYIQAQIYQSASGELLNEELLQGSGSLLANDIRLNIEHFMLPRFEAVYNPGAVFEGLGMLTLIAVVIGQWRTAKAAQDGGVPEADEPDQAESKE